VEAERLAVGISCNPIWDGGDATREILTGIYIETAAETGGNREAASKHWWEEGKCGETEYTDWFENK